jgi:hypothetical protein
MDEVMAVMKVVGMQSGVSVDVHERNGSLQLNILQSGAYINDLDVQLSGESSWLYQWYEFHHIFRVRPLGNSIKISSSS